MTRAKSRAKRRTPIGQLTDRQLAAEMKRTGKEWDEFRKDSEGGSPEGGGSPGEGICARMGALETERKRRMHR